MKKLFYCILALVTALAILPGKMNTINAVKISGTEITVNTSQDMVFNLTTDETEAFEMLYDYCRMKDSEVGDKYIWIYKTSSTGAYCYVVGEMKMVDQGGTQKQRLVNVTDSYEFDLSDYTKIHAYLQTEDAFEMAGFYVDCALDNVTAETFDFNKITGCNGVLDMEEVGKQLIANPTEGTRIIYFSTGLAYSYIYYENSEWKTDGTESDLNNLLAYAQNHDVYVVGESKNKISEINFTQYPTQIDYTGIDQQSVISDSNLTLIYQGIALEGTDSNYTYYTVLRPADGYYCLGTSGWKMYGNVGDVTINGAGPTAKAIVLDDFYADSMRDKFSKAGSDGNFPEFKNGDIIVRSELENVRTELGKIEMTIAIPESVPVDAEGYEEIVQFAVVEYDTEGNQIASFNEKAHTFAAAGWLLNFDSDAEINKNLEEDSSELTAQSIGGTDWVGVKQYLDHVETAYTNTQDEKYTFKPENYYYAYAYECVGERRLFKPTASTKVIVNGAEVQLPYPEYFTGIYYIFDVFGLGKVDAEGKFVVPQLVNTDEGDCLIDADGNGSIAYDLAKAANVCAHINGIALNEIVDDDDDASNGYSGIIVKQGDKALTYGTDYTVSDGLKVTLNKTLLNKLAVGEYTFTVSIETEFKTYSFVVDVEIKERAVPKLIEEDNSDCEVKANGDGFGRYAIAETAETCAHIDGIELADVADDDDDPTNGYSGIVVKLGNKTLTYGTDYTVESGSVKVILSKTVLDTLPVGTSTFDITVTDDLNSHQFAINVEIYEKQVPKTGDASTMFVLMQLGSAVALGTACYVRKKKEQN